MKKFSWLSKVLLVSVVVILVAAGCNNNKNPEVNSGNQPSTQDQSGTQDQSVKTEVISYQGVEGKNALDLLKASYTVETENFSGIGEFVKTINGVAPSKDQFWGFYVNGVSSNVGAAQYMTKATDKIEWKLDTINEYKE